MRYRQLRYATNSIRGRSIVVAPRKSHAPLQRLTTLLTNLRLRHINPNPIAHPLRALPTVALYYTRARTNGQNLTRTTCDSSRCKRLRLRTQPASATWPLTPASRCPDAPLTRFHAASAPTFHPRPHSASKRHTANLERRSANRERRTAATRGRTRRSTRRYTRVLTDARAR